MRFELISQEEKSRNGDTKRVRIMSTFEEEKNLNEHM